MKSTVFLLFMVFALLLMSSSCTGEKGPVEKASVSAENYLALLPAQTNFLFYANFKELKETPVGEEIRAEFENKIKNEDENEDYWEFVEKTGFDLQRDLHEVWVSAVAESKDDHKGGAVLRGNFDEERIVDYLKKEEPRKYQENSYLGHTIYTIDREDNQFTFLNKETLVFGKPEWVKSILDNSGKKSQNVLDNAEMAKYIDQIPQKRQMWGVVNLTDLAETWAQEVRKRGSGFKGTESIEKLQSLLFYTNVDEKADINVKGFFSDAEQADLMAEMLIGFKAMAKLMVSDDKEAVDMLNDIKVKSDGSQVNISATLDKEFFEKVEEKRKKFQENSGKVL